MDEIVEYIESVQSVDLGELVYLGEIAKPLKMVDIVVWLKQLKLGCSKGSHGWNWLKGSNRMNWLKWLLWVKEIVALKRKKM